MYYAHGLQFVIQDLFYKKQIGYTEEASDYLSEIKQYEEEINEMEDSDGLTMVTAAGTQQGDS